MCAEEEFMAAAAKIEHAMFKIQYGILPDGLFHVVPNPRKSEAIDVFIVLPDGRVHLVSNKVVSIIKDRPTARQFKVTGFRTELITLIFALEASKTVYLVQPKDIKGRITSVSLMEETLTS